MIFTHGANSLTTIRQGDVLYVPSACAYTPNHDGSVPEGTPEGTAKIIALETLDDAAMRAAGYVSVGVVAAVFGRKVYVIWKTILSNVRFCKDATNSLYSIPSDIDVDDLIHDNVEDRAGRIGFRAVGCYPVLRAKLSGEGLPPGSPNTYDGSIDGGDGSWFYTLQEWTTTNKGNKHPSAEEIANYGAGVDGWEKYLYTRYIGWPSAYNIALYTDGSEATAVMVRINSTKGYDYFPPANYATTHHTTYGSFGTGKNFWNVPGLRYGDWFMPNVAVMQPLFYKISYQETIPLPPDDKINVAMSKISGNYIFGYVAYWYPWLRNRNSAHTLSTAGQIGFPKLRLSGTGKVLSCASLNY